MKRRRNKRSQLKSRRKRLGVIKENMRQIGNDNISDVQRRLSRAVTKLDGRMSKSGNVLNWRNDYFHNAGFEGYLSYPNSRKGVTVSYEDMGGGEGFIDVLGSGRTLYQYDGRITRSVINDVEEVIHDHFRDTLDEIRELNKNPYRNLNEGVKRLSERGNYNRLRRSRRSQNRRSIREAYDSFNVPATIEGDQMGNVIINFEYDGSKVDHYVKGQSEIETLIDNLKPDEPGIRDAKEAVYEVLNGYLMVDVLLNDEYAFTLDQDMDLYR